MTQAQALKIMASGANVFLTGAPGAGKTYTLDQFITASELEDKRVAVTASTGIAASHIGGTTIHSWSGLGIAELLSDDLLAKLKNSRHIRKRLNRTDILVIDEVSMLHGSRLNMVNKLCKEVRDNKLPFGGLQVILVGDLFQLPPVSPGGGYPDFAHQADAWAELNLRICYITEQHRQNATDPLLDILRAMRINKVHDGHTLLLDQRNLPADDKITRLYSHNVDVDAINRDRLEAIKGKNKQYKMHHEGDPRRVEALTRNILAPELLELKMGAEVMFVANNFQAGFVNGSRGTITGYKDGLPLVKMKSGRVVKVKRHAWNSEENGVILATVEQYPLRLAWAITIHKSQGMSLDAAVIDLSRTFTPGMGYVALSRVRALTGLYLSGINEMAMRLHPDIYALDAELMAASEGNR